MVIVVIYRGQKFGAAVSSSGTYLAFRRGEASIKQNLLIRR